MSIFQAWHEDDEMYDYKVIFPNGGGFCCPRGLRGHFTPEAAARHGAEVLVQRALEAHAA